METYTPIILEFQPAVLDGNGEAYQSLDKYRLLVETPSTPVSYPQVFLFDIPSNGILKLQLLPSDYYLPKGRYRVKYYKHGRSLAIAEQEWIIPEKPPVRQFSYVEGANWPNDLFSLLPSPDYIMEPFSWINPPPASRPYDIDYQPGLRLENIVVKR